MKFTFNLTGGKTIEHTTHQATRWTLNARAFRPGNFSVPEKRRAFLVTMIFELFSFHFHYGFLEAFSQIQALHLTTIQDSVMQILCPWLDFTIVPLCFLGFSFPYFLLLILLAINFLYTILNSLWNKAECTNGHINRSLQDLGQREQHILTLRFPSPAPTTLTRA